MTNSLSPYAAEFIGEQWGHGEDKNTAAQMVAYAILGATLAYVNGGNSGAGASAAVASEAAAQYLTKQFEEKYKGDERYFINGIFQPNLLPEDVKAQIRDLTVGIGAVIGGAVGDSSYNVQLAGVIGKNAVENNQLKPTDSANYAILVSKYKKDCEGGNTASHCEKTKNEILAIVNRGKTIAKEEFIDGGADSFLGKDATVLHKPGDVVGCITIHGSGVCQVTNKQINGEYVLSPATEAQKNSYIQKNIESNEKLMRLASDAFNNGCASVGIVSTACSAAMAYYGVDPVTKRKLTTTERGMYAANAGLNIVGGSVAIKTSRVSGEISHKLGEIVNINNIEHLRVGRWMSPQELEKIQKTGRVQEGAGSQTFISLNGSNDFKGAAQKEAVYVEFDVPKNSLIKGGKDGWFKMIGPAAGKSQQALLNKQGGSHLPQIQNLKIVDKK